MSLPARTVDVLVVGAGQAGLGTARRLVDAGVPDVLVLEAAEVGASWTGRWAGLRLFTPRRFSTLPGLPFPPGPGESPTRLEMAAYLRRYADVLDVPVVTGTPVTGLTRAGTGFRAATPAGEVTARQVVVATGPHRRPRVPAAAADLAPDVVALHSSAYREPADLPDGPVLVVGGGNSAAQLALELAATRPVTVAAPGVPRALPTHVLGISLYRWLLVTGVLNAGSGTPVGRLVRRRDEAVFGRDLPRAVRAGRVRLVPHRVVGAAGRAVTLADGSVLPVHAVLWCTGFLPDTGWLEIPGALGPGGEPVHRRGASPVPGLHWMGLPWQTRVNSGLVDGVDRDARRTAGRIRRALDGAVGRRDLGGPPPHRLGRQTRWPDPATSTPPSSPCPSPRWPTRP
ncbi:flavin-containing monooxygenase [Geodermatophilus marinus]|uniref:flavin-containing monooxygenase n=1 Tax=Geodermatophilus sp. LHW52908 TaxID=2303986 RepID=UPI001314FB8D|nr:FAD-dependent oxidoreductase [Geodermatophilus sp. LHW52908]